jgi:hypothetical protein
MAKTLFLVAQMQELDDIRLRLMEFHSKYQFPALSEKGKYILTAANAVIMAFAEVQKEYEAPELFAEEVKNIRDQEKFDATMDSFKHGEC